ncbi:hypothetical protein SASPL_126966 [Salvia splendens]|uniref:Uncharacterized protein n=1 Tax=Salvia splendens TaxID=180675 RepID=A0A8X8XIM6_SALSN|nr:hypothetical protein SASPL_126966 [Salvia splendens]
MCGGVINSSPVLKRALSPGDMSSVRRRAESTKEEFSRFLSQVEGIERNSYKGDPDNLKAIGLQGASVRILQILRGRYCKNMLLAPFNIAKERFLSYLSHYINVTPTFRTDYARQVNGC